jgi:hypothetical protein|tara:strand:+ start:136 stop:459 length:324 start_codon:yes stop_codon:yes gene_type:complete
MAIEWTVVQLERELADGGVVVAHWRVTDTEVVGTGDDAVTYTASSYGTCGFTYDASSPTYIPYDDVTETEVLGWCYSDGIDKDAVEASLAANIALQINPVTADGVPW